ncbi:nucleolar GTP-binding protein 1-like [Histomonas meleagridis]|uniref:nucleolar GTP-binding protein 1-like n=1 Tax=Histomonas meleagridis TaxID=135588 RepID=UPI00355A680F|nr:nucleolar GTP-binding protein 1-like [Histomonas meleagridis]KAH0804448.1 nucleolar GTP-binding protein 1-like [Histomonas meleagridis]
MALIFNTIHPIPTTAQGLIDIVLSATNRKTATVVHPGYQISRIRNFYMTKIEFAQNEFHKRLSQIIDDFPRLDAIHPFWASLINVIYDQDHYKLALGQVSGARNLVDKIGRDYVKYMKYGDSLYRCKSLKKSALGRMCTACRRLTPSLQYLEEVRMHLQRLPAIDPSSPTIILSGAPSTGKSSFMNLITRANVEVAAFPFTTKSLYLGHTDWAYLKWQVIDTPGLLDRPLEDRNTIEMTAVMAMVHLRAAIVYMLDISGSCGYTIEQQVSLFHSLNEIFSNRPVTVVLTKCDLISPDSLSPNEKALIDSMLAPNVEFRQMSAITGDGVAEVKESVCQRLLDMRVETKRTSDKIDKVRSQLTIAQPEAPLEPNIPPTVFAPQGLNRPLARELEEQQGGAGCYVPNTNEEKILANDEWKTDIIPEIIEGRNVADFIDPNINEKLQKLLEEETVRYAEYQKEKEDFEANKWHVAPDQEEMVKLIRERRAIIRTRAQTRAGVKSIMPTKHKKRTQAEVVEHVNKLLTERGVDDETRAKAVEKVLSQKPKRVQRVMEKESRNKGVQKRGPGERFDYYVKKNDVLEPKFLFSGKSGFKRDFK